VSIEFDSEYVPPLPTAPIGHLGRVHHITHTVDAAGRITHVARDGQLVPVAPRAAAAATPAPAPAPAPLWHPFAPPMPTISDPHAGSPAPAPAPKAPSGPPSVAELKARFAQFR
jgi:hypothetical protein